MTTQRLFERMSNRARKTGLRTADISLTGSSVPSAAATAGVSAVRTEPRIFREVFTFTSVAVSLTDNTTAGAQGSLQFVAFPEGLIRPIGASCNLSLAIGAGVASAVVASIGSAAAANTDATLTSTEADVIPSTSCSITSSAATFAGKMTSSQAGAVLDGSSSAAGLFLNIAATDANTTGAGPFTITVSGTITLTWMDLGDN